MCKWGTSVVVRVRIGADLSHTGEERWKEADIDACIASLVAALQAGGIDMRASCCGHGHRPGNIALADGRELMIISDFALAREVERTWPDIHGTPAIDFPPSGGTT